MCSASTVTGMDNDFAVWRLIEEAAERGTPQSQVAARVIAIRPGQAVDQTAMGENMETLYVNANKSLPEVRSALGWR